MFRMYGVLAGFQGLGFKFKELLGLLGVGGNKIRVRV